MANRDKATNQLLNFKESQTVCSLYLQVMYCDDIGSALELLLAVATLFSGHLRCTLSFTLHKKKPTPLKFIHYAFPMSQCINGYVLYVHND